MGVKRIEERFVLSGGRVDRTDPAHPYVREALLCGPTSANKRRYRAEAFAGERIKRYADRLIYLNHGTGRASRNYEDKIATIENPRLRADGMPVGDLAINPKHPYAETFLWDAEHKPRSCGMSHVAHCETVTSSDGWEEITEVVSVESVDVVTDPATTHGLHENRSQPVPITAKQLVEWVIKSPKATTTHIEHAKKLAEDMGGMGLADTPIEAPADDADPGDGLESGIKAGIMELIEGAMDDPAKAVEALKHIKTLLKAHAKVKGKGGDDTATETETTPESKAVKPPEPWTVLRECQDADYAPSAAELELLAGQPDAAKRKAFVTEQKKKLADLRAERPQSGQRKPGGGESGKKVTEQVEEPANTFAWVE